MRQLSAPAIHLLGFFRPAHPVEDPPHEVERFCVIRDQLDGPLQRVPGAGQITLLVESITQVVVGPAVIGLELEGAVKAYCGFLHQAPAP